MHLLSGYRELPSLLAYPASSCGPSLCAPPSIPCGYPPSRPYPLPRNPALCPAPSDGPVSLSLSLSPHPPVLNRNLEATTIPSPHRNCRHNCASLPNRIRNPHLHLLTIDCTCKSHLKTSQKQSSIAHPHLSLNDIPSALLVLQLRLRPLSPFFWVVLDLSLSRLNYWQSIHAQKGLACFILCHNAHPQKREKALFLLAHTR